MAKKVLYRKYRPQKFSDVVGQESIIQTLSNAVVLNRVAHAYLFSGPRGIGKTTIARILAKAVNCENISGGEPCGKCSACADIQKGKAIDLVEIDAASHRGIDDIREIKEGIGFVPSRFNYKVYIVDEAHQLTKEAANAFLKVLEEPPGHAIFILATTEAHKMLATIISRCQRFDFKKLTLPQIEKQLLYIIKAEGMKADDGAVEVIAANSGGSLRDAESMLDHILTFSLQGGSNKISAKIVKDVLGFAQTTLVGRFVGLLAERNIKELLVFVEKIFEEGYDIEQFTSALIDYLRQALLVKINPDAALSAFGLAKEEFEKLEKQALSMSQAYLLLALNAFLDAENKQRYSSLPQLPLELALVKILEDKK